MIPIDLLKTLKCNRTINHHNLINLPGKLLPSGFCPRVRK